MSEHLRGEYEKYLARYGLKPRKLPSRQDQQAGNRAVTRIMYEAAKSEEDPFAEAILIAYEKNRHLYLAETRHSATIIIENIVAELEDTIRALPSFADKLHVDVFVGEFPTGSINCQTVKVDGGFLILVNSGTLSMLQQVVNFLWRGDEDPSSARSQEVADGVAEVLGTYIEHGDSFYGPKPLNGFMRTMGAALMDAAATKFVIAHEYGHILAGHMTEADVEPLMLKTEVGNIPVIRKNHLQEFEADEIGYRLTLGVESSDDFDLAIIDAGYNSDDLDVLRAVARQKCLIAGPFVPLTVDMILERFVDAACPTGYSKYSRDTHPPASERMRRLLESSCSVVMRCPGDGVRYWGFINLPLRLLQSKERIVGVMCNRLFQPHAAATEDTNHATDEAAGDWFDEIMQCVDAIRAGDNTAGALLLTDAFEKQHTVFESDADVVRRELVRAALGRRSDIRQTLLDRHRERRIIEQHIKSQSALDLVKNKEPNGLELVRTVLEEEVNCRQNVGTEVHLLCAVLFTWIGERNRSLSSFEAALAEGMADRHGRLARFVALEKRALELEVQLDIQELLGHVRRKAISGNKKTASELATLVKEYTEYLNIPLGPVARRLIDAQLESGA